MRILTFNWHEAYICTLAKTGHRFDVIERQKGGSRVWFYETRPLPANARIVKEASARAGLRAGAYDAVICHNVQDVLWAREWRVPKIVVFHNLLTTEIALGGYTVDRESHRAEVAELVATTEATRLVFISETKRADWDLDGVVVTPGVDLDDYGGYRGDDPRVLRVGNFMRRRDLMLGHTAQLAILGDRPSTLLGLNEPADNARFTRSWNDLKEAFRSHRVFLNTTVDGFEDGYNLSMLEAMATGMPVVSTPNRTSPLVDGENGVVSGDLAYLSSRIDELFNDVEIARRLGAEARSTVARLFGMGPFVEAWNGILGHGRRPSVTVSRSAGAVGVSIRPRTGASSDVPRRRIVLSYVSYPATTARYLEASLRRSHDVITVGPAIDDGIIEAWNLRNMRESVRPHDVTTGYEDDAERIVAALPRGWEPELFLWVESVYGHFPAGVARLECPTACYLIDSHMNLPWHLDWSTRFDHVFVAQREYLPAFAQAGVSRVEWLPLACDPSVHGRQDVDVEHDIGFVGSLTEHHVRRRELLDRLGRRFDVHVERSFLTEMARTFSASRIVFNDAVKRDLNMRVFEALASGAMLLTDRAPGSGLDEMFVDREHLVLYDDSDVEELAAYYLAHDDECREIAARGRAEVLRWHTYDHRARALVDAVFEPAAAPAADPWRIGFVDDPLVAEAVALTNARRFGDALERVDLVREHRELHPYERLTLANARATCLRQLGRDEEAGAASLSVLAGLPPACRTALQPAV